jgi:hypothetical protein
MSASMNSRLLLIVREHPALLVSALYVAASVVGMFYSWAYLRNFGVNVFNYAQISDFLLASLKEPFTWALVAIAISIVMLDNAYSRRVEGRGTSKWFAWYGSSTYRFVNNFGAVVIVGIFIFAYANIQAADTRKGDGKIVETTLAEGGGVKSAMLLGTTGQFIFLYDATTKRVDIHPVEAIQVISFVSD